MDSHGPTDNYHDFDAVRRGYDMEQVDEHIAMLHTRIKDLKEQLKAAEVLTQSLQKKLSVPRAAEEEIGAAYLAAADAKQRLLDNARQKADDIIAAAENQARRLSGTDTARRVSDAEQEAQRIIHEAKAEAERMVARTRTEALAAVASAQREVETMLARHRDAHGLLVDQLSGLKQAVDTAVEKAERDRRVFEMPLSAEVPAVKAVKA